jgi:2-dehydropantoate 2-reductase
VKGTVLVLGAGGVGGYFGGRLAQAGGDVTFLVREARREALATHGLRIASPFGDATLHVRTMASSEVRHAFAVVLLTCKAYDLEDAIASIRPAVGPDTVVIPVLNGVAHIDALNAAFGPERVFGGVAKIQSTVEPDGTIRHLNDWRFLSFGEQSGGISSRAEAVAALFGPAIGVSVEAVPDIMQRIWDKLVHICSAASMTSLMRANIGEIARTPEGAEIFGALLDTVVEVATRSGYPPTPEFVGTYRALFSDRSSPYSTSMLRDIERGGRTEGEHIIGWTLRRARALGIEDATLRLAYTHIKAYEERRNRR